VTVADSLASFKSKLKTHLFKSDIWDYINMVLYKLGDDDNDNDDDY